MVDPLSLSGLRPGLPAPAGAAAPTTTSAGEDFATALRAQLKQVNEMQSEADANVQKLVTGESASMVDVFAAARKAQVAFGLLMEMRNKLVDAYQELQNMRV
jgi:flagellar hook-basal body complex protein FliE